MSILTNVLPAPTEIYTGPWPAGFVVYDWDPRIVASAQGHYAAHLGSFGSGDAGKTTFGVYVIIYEWPWTAISYMPLVPRVLHVDLEVIGNSLYAYSQMASGTIWWKLPGWKPYGVMAATARTLRSATFRARSTFGRKPIPRHTLPDRLARPPRPPAEWLAEWGE